MAEQSKIVKTVTDAAVLVGLAAFIGWVGKKVLKESLTGDPSANFMNYGKWVTVLSGSILLKDLFISKTKRSFQTACKFKHTIMIAKWQASQS